MRDFRNRLVVRRQHVGRYLKARTRWNQRRALLEALETRELLAVSPTNTGSDVDFDALELGNPAITAMVSSPGEGEGPAAPASMNGSGSSGGLGPITGSSPGLSDLPPAYLVSHRGRGQVYVRGQIDLPAPIGSMIPFEIYEQTGPSDRLLAVRTVTKSLS